MIFYILFWAGVVFAALVAFIGVRDYLESKWDAHNWVTVTTDYRGRTTKRAGRKSQYYWGGGNSETESKTSLSKLKLAKSIVGVTWRAIWATVMGAVIAAFVILIYSGVATAVIASTGDTTDKNSYSLTAIGSGSEVEGRYRGAFFVATGYVDEEPVFKYIRSEGEGNVLRSMNADNAVIYEQDGEPRVDVYTWYGEDQFWIPWRQYVGDTANFFVPEGSITAGYEIGVE